MTSSTDKQKIKMDSDEESSDPMRGRNGAAKTHWRKSAPAQPAFDHLESILWEEGVICPHCGTVGKAGKLA